MRNDAQDFYVQGVFFMAFSALQFNNPPTFFFVFFCSFESFVFKASTPWRSSPTRCTCRCGHCKHCKHQRIQSRTEECLNIQEIYAAASPIYRSLKKNPPRYHSVIQCSNWYPPSIIIIKYSNISHSTSSRTLNPHFASDVELCPCVNDVTANGVLNELTVYAQKLKYYSVDQR